MCVILLCWWICCLVTFVVSTSKSLAEMDLLDNMMENIHTSSPPEKKHLDHDFDTDNEADESSRVYGGRVLRIHDVPIVGPQF